MATSPPDPPGHHGAAARPRGGSRLLLAAGASVALSLFTFDPLPGLALLALVLLWHLSVRRGFPAVVPLFFSLHWLQLYSGVYYELLTGRAVEASRFDVHPMGYVGLAYLAALFGGFCAGARGLRVSADRSPGAPASIRAPLRWYVLWLPIDLSLQGLAWQASGLTQQLLALAQLRFVFFTLLVMHLAARSSWRAIAALLAFETAYGFTSFFADFKAPLLLAVAVLLDAWRRRQPGAGRAAVAAVAGLLVFALVWTGIKPRVRADHKDDDDRVVRLVRAVDHTVDWAEERSFLETLDRLVARTWELEYPAQVLERVPRLLPHEDGELLLRAVRHVLIPRAIDPDKPRLVGDSELVRRYAGVWVAGAESGTSVGLSYVAESYIDFGIPGMFVPVFAFGWLVGAMLAFLQRRLTDPWLRDATLTTLVAVTLNRFEVPWTKVLGTALTLIVVIGAALLVWERYVVPRRALRRSALP